MPTAKKETLDIAKIKERLKRINNPFSLSRKLLSHKKKIPTPSFLSNLILTVFYYGIII